MVRFLNPKSPLGKGRGQTNQFKANSGEREAKCLKQFEANFIRETERWEDGRNGHN
jgi:hypothetical protein